MEYLYLPAENSQWTLVLMHGTGGTEQDLLSVGKAIGPSANLLALRGQVVENSALRFFKRKAEGIYDLDDLAIRREEITQLIQNLSEENSFDISKVIFVGFSNGANMAIDLLIHRDDLFTKAVLFAPLYPMSLPPSLDLSAHHIFMSMGKADPICDMNANLNLISKLQEKQAQLTVEWVHTHQITPTIVESAKNWFNNLSNYY